MTEAEEETETEAETEAVTESETETETENRSVKTRDAAYRNHRIGRHPLKNIPEGGTNMTTETRNYVTEKTKELMAAFSCSKEAKEAAQAWLDAAGTDREKRRPQDMWRSLRQTLCPWSS